MPDPRIAALARDPRAAPVLERIVAADGGDFIAPGSEIIALVDAATSHGLGDLAPLDACSVLLEHVRSVADESIVASHGALRRAFHGSILLGPPDPGEGEGMLLALLRDDDCARWPADAACDATDALVDAGLLTPDEEPAPLALTGLGRAVLLVLERRLASRE